MTKETMIFNYVNPSLLGMKAYHMIPVWFHWGTPQDDWNMGFFWDIETHWTFAFFMYLISVGTFHFLIVYYCFCRNIYFWPLVWMRIPKPSWLVQVFFPGSNIFHGNWRPPRELLVRVWYWASSLKTAKMTIHYMHLPVTVSSCPCCIRSILVFFRGQEGETCVSGILCWWFSVWLKRTLLVIRRDAVDGRNPAPPGMYKAL